MSERDKENRYCIPCETRGNHTSLDHRQCPEKRRLVQEKIKAARDKRKNEESEDKRDTNLIKKTLEMASSDAWPALQNSQEQQQKTSTIVVLALLDEAHSPGSFQRKFSTELKKNGLPEVNYEPEPGTATFMANLMAGAYHTENNPQAHKSSTPLGRTPTLHSPTVTKTSTLQTLGVGAVPAQFKIISNQTNISKRGRTANSSMSLDDSILELASKKHREDGRIFLSQPQTSTLSMEEELNIKEIHKHLLNKMKEKSIGVSEKLKYMFPKGKDRIRKHFNMTEFAKLLQNSDLIMDGKEKREILQEVDYLINASSGGLEISFEINYSGPRTIDRTTSDDDYQVFP